MDLTQRLRELQRLGCGDRIDSAKELIHQLQRLTVTGAPAAINDV